MISQESALLQIKHLAQTRDSGATAEQWIINDCRSFDAGQRKSAGQMTLKEIYKDLYRARSAD
jgi:hypothetical protein